MSDTTPETPKLSLRDKLRAIAGGTTKQLVPVPEWGEGEVIEVRRLTVAYKAVWQSLAHDPSIKVDPDADEDEPLSLIVRTEMTERSMAALIVATSFQPETDDRIFEDRDVVMLMKLATEHKAVMDRLISASVDLNAFGKEAPKEAENFSETTPTGESSPESPPKPASRRRR